MAAECARDALLQKVVDNKTDSGIDCLFRVCSFFFSLCLLWNFLYYYS